MEKECNAHSCCRVYQKLSGPVELLLLKEKNPANIKNMQYLSFNTRDIFLVLLADPGLCCLAFASKSYLNQSSDSKGAELCFFCVIPLLFWNVWTARKKLCYMLSASLLCCIHMAHSGLICFSSLCRTGGARLSFTSVWDDEHALVAEQISVISTYHLKLN